MESELPLLWIVMGAFWVPAPFILVNNDYPPKILEMTESAQRAPQSNEWGIYARPANTRLPRASQPPRYVACICIWRG